MADRRLTIVSRGGRHVGIAGLLAALAIGLVSCNDPGLPVTLHGPTTIIRASNVVCTSEGSTITVTGDLIGVATIPYDSQPSASIQDASGMRIGSRSGPVLAVHPGQPTSFSVSVAVNGSPASCFLGWGAALASPP
jgi:hypothetical protein